MFQLPWQPGLVRLYASSSTNAEPLAPEIKIADNLSLRKSVKIPLNDANTTGKRPLVLLLSWLAAKQQHLGNFARFYLDQGCDVLTVKVRPMQILLPQQGAQVVAQNVVKFVQSAERQDQPILVHGFSVGGYVYSEILTSMLATQKDEEITGRIIGQIWDSAVDVGDIPDGMSRALLKNTTMQTGMRKSLDVYMRMTHNFAGQHLLRGSRLFYHNPVKAPSLFFYSDSDPISSPRINEKCIASLKDTMGHPSVRSKEFKNSPHVSHMYKYREEYVSTLRSFLQQIEYFKTTEDEGCKEEAQDTDEESTTGRESAV